MKDWAEENSESRKGYYHDYHLANAEHKCQMANDWYYNNYDRAQESRKNYYYYEHQDEILEYYKTNETFKKAHRKQAKKDKAKRKSMGFILLFKNPFPNEIKVDYHHINNLLVVPIPKRIHSICSNNNPSEHREHCNMWLYYLYNLDIDKLFN